MKYYFVCNVTNELYILAKKVNKDVKRCENINQALLDITPNSFLCIFEENYPQKKNVFTKEVLDTLKKNNIKTIIEYPKEVYCLKKSTVIKTDRERIVDVNTLELGQNNSHFVLSYDVDEKYVKYSFSKVAGYKKAAYGLAKENIPYIFIHPSYNNVLIVTSKFSSPITSRFKPQNFFNNLYKKILNLDITYKESVSAKFDKDKVITEIEIKNTIKLSTKWFKKYMLLKDTDGSKVYEGLSSYVNYDGSQVLANAIRNDCIGESSLVFALDYFANNNKTSEKIADSLIKFIFQSNNQELNMGKDEGGFISWYGNGNSKFTKIYYTDDNARLLLGVIPSVNIIKNNKYNEGIIKCVLAYLRSIPEKGITINSLRFNDKMVVSDYTYKDIKDKISINYSPHYVSYIWAAFLMVYKITGDKALLDISKKGIYTMMAQYPNNWKWTNGIMAEVSRMILPLALLYKYDKDIKTKKYLETLYDVISEQTDDYGCMIEKMVLLENGKYPPPKSNEDYGKYEAPIIHENGDNACDLLYSQNFAYLGLNEAYHATNDIKYKKLYDEMTEFFVKIQTKSIKHKNLDGIWMRSFDSNIWEYFGSGADAGWAALCAESGWTNSWINIAMNLGLQNKSLTDYIEKNDDFKKMYWDIKKTLK